MSCHGDEHLPDLLLLAGLAISQNDAFSLAATRRVHMLANGDPTTAAGMVNRGAALGALERPAAALDAADAALGLDPHFPAAWSLRGTVLLALGRADEALASFDRALALRPENPDDLHNRAASLLEAQRHHEAIDACVRTLAWRPRFPAATLVAANAFLALGDYERGWPLLESRLQITAQEAGERYFSAPRWTGGDLAGRRLLVTAEEGLGDMIQLSRFAPVAVDRGARVVIEAHPPLLRLLRSLGPGIKAIAPGAAAGPVDMHCPAMSLPMGFGAAVDSIPSAPYLRAEPAAAAMWRDRLAALPGRKVGVVWASGRWSRLARVKSIPAALLAPLGAVLDVTFVSLQKDTVGALPLPLVDWTAELSDFADTAALIESLDLVITVDTAVAHLAGALGKPAWIMLPFAACWRWLVGRSDSPWYPTARLFRQAAAGEWGSVVAEVAAELSDGAAGGILAAGAGPRV